jgi:hydroxymethylbilane synthase
MSPLRIGTRGSALALAQAGTVADAIGDAELVPIRTAGDEGGPSAAADDDKSRFVREIERALLSGEIELAVHSAKDLPGELPEGLQLVGVPAREDPADAWIGDAASLGDVREGALVGTASLRRRSQLLALRPDLEVVDLRGNVDTRIRRLREGDLDGIVLAAAGLRRLGREGEISFRFGLDELTPAPGQGSLALEGRSGDGAALAAAASITDRDALIELTAERAAVAGLDASCDTPVGVCARHVDGSLVLRGFAGLPDGTEHVLERVEGDPGQPVALGEALVERMAAAGALELLARAEGIAG